MSDASAHETGHGHAHGGGHHPHVVPMWLLFGVIGILLFLTVVTVAAAQVDLGGGANVVVAVLIASVKAAFVALYFMHLRWDKPFNAFILLLSIFFLALFLGFALLDTSQYQDSIDVRYAEESIKALKAAQPAAAH